MIEMLQDLRDLVNLLAEVGALLAGVLLIVLCLVAAGVAISQRMRRQGVADARAASPAAASRPARGLRARTAHS